MHGAYCTAKSHRQHSRNRVTVKSAMTFYITLEFLYLIPSAEEKHHPAPLGSFHLRYLMVLPLGVLSTAGTPTVLPARPTPRAALMTFLGASRSYHRRIQWLVAASEEIMYRRLGGREWLSETMPSRTCRRHRRVGRADCPDCRLRGLGTIAEESEARK